MSGFQCFRSPAEIARDLVTSAQASGNMTLLAALVTSSVQGCCWHLADGQGRMEAFLTTFFTSGLSQRIALGLSQHPSLCVQSLLNWVSARGQKQEEKASRGFSCICF